jgi:hypothetical protein
VEGSAVKKLTHSDFRRLRYGPRLIRVFQYIKKNEGTYGKLVAKKLGGVETNTYDLIRRLLRFGLVSKRADDIDSRIQRLKAERDSMTVVLKLGGEV